MLLSFKVANHGSFKDIQELSMHRAIRPSDRNEAWRDPGVSPVAAIYGGNASGKSTLVRAIRFIISAVEDSYRSWPVEGGTPRDPFALDADSHACPSQYEIEFIAEDRVTYLYGFELDDERVLSEHLYAYRTNRRTLLFERRGEVWKFGPSFRGPANQIKETTRKNALFLSAAAASGNKTIQEAHFWLTNRIRMYHSIGFRREHPHVIRRLQEDARFARRLKSVLKHADLGITNIEVVENAVSEEEREAIAEYVKRIAEPSEAAAMLTRLQTQKKPDLELTHMGAAGHVSLPFSSESDGTHALISFASIAISALETGATCIVDEIDSSLHPLLVAELVRIFNDPLINQLQAQLVFTTHDTSLLETEGPIEILERDQIWVVEKDSRGASELIALSDFGLPRAGSNLARGYLTGRYGGIPSVSIVNDLLTEA